MSMVASHGPKLRCALCRFALLSAVALMVAGCGSETTPELAATRMPAPMVRVRLGPPRQEAVITVQGKCQVYDLASRRLLRSEDELSGALFTVRGEGLDLDGRPLGSPHVTIVAHAGGTILVDRQPYRGNIHVVAASGKVLLVNVLNVEDYVASVVGGELYRKWHIECHKAQAIAARTYALYQMAHRSAARAYDVTDSPASSQAYKGIESETEVTREAAAATRGIVLTYDAGGTAKLFEAFYHSTCGGRTVSAWDRWPKVPRIEPLSGIPCPYCTASPHHRWSLSMGSQLLARKLRSLDSKLKGMQDVVKVWVSDRHLTPDGRVRAVWITDDRGGSWQIASKAFKKCFPDATRFLSSRFSLTLEGGNVVVHGRGYGHAIGMCQWGAQGQATKGRRAEAILHFYYPGSRLARVY
jgi:stage II sporulation protein D (peptidoglycan lytic transglycosylase)